LLSPDEIPAGRPAELLSILAGDLGKDLRMNETEHAMETSAAHLRGRVEDLDAVQLTRQAYPTKWTIADVLSHLGSGAVIMRRRIEAEVDHEPVPDGFNQSVWDEWNAKDPSTKAADSLVADRQLLDRVGALTDEQRNEFHAAIGPMSVDFTHFLGLRLNEHTLHTWDIEVVFDPAATLQDEATTVVIDNLEVIGRFGGKPDGIERTVTVKTTAPERAYLITTTADSVSLEPTTSAKAPDIELPAEAFIRLVYGRLDPEHTPEGTEIAVVESLRKVFRGI
jgi:uncharacterized protein (TIGR03083 family)